MMQDPIISIITCFLNEESFLEEAIEGVLQQQFLDWELLLINDGSSDRSPDIAKGFAERFPSKIFYFEHTQNMGLSASRNLALQKSRGEYIALLDADDFWLPSYLCNILQIMLENPVSLVCEASEYWYNWDDPDKLNKIKPIGTEGNKMYSPPFLLLTLYPLGSGTSPCPCGMLLKADRLKAHGGFNEAFSVYEDQAFLTKFYLNDLIYISSNCNNKYRVREGSMVRSSYRGGKYHNEKKNFLKWLEQYLEVTGNSNFEIQKLLRSRSLRYRFPLINFLFITIPSKGSHHIRKWLKNI